ncbi:integrase core domain-containing protein [Streptomyces sp. NPDC056656]|uniref:integrase core domain-containing protein n=1 Tax=Streptomyces sp. NPDC056656 TaxID=3345895 RepID=UPI0036859A4C
MLLRRRHARASWNKQPRRPRTVRTVRALVLRLARENSTYAPHNRPGHPDDQEPRDGCSRRGHPREVPHPRPRYTKYPALIDEILTDADIRTVLTVLTALTALTVLTVLTVLTGVRMPRMNSIMERWVRTLRRALLERTLIWNEQHLRHALRAYKLHYNEHRTHRSLQTAAPLHTLPQPLEPERIASLRIRRHDRLGGDLHEYRHAA